MDATIDHDLLSTYLDDHLAGATAGLSRTRRMASAYEGTPIGGPLTRIAHELADERRWLIQTAKNLGVTRTVVKRVGAAVGERLGRLKLNGRIVRQSPLTPLLELELLRSAAVGKLSLWQTLEANATPIGLSQVQVDRLGALQEQAGAQVDTISELLGTVRPKAFLG